ncbi:hypothetical protein [Chryseolinea lacunae]|uniref:DUF4834 domain-containing protein n=1 Tax=Chryseolinea lacunae TaxID=2801331 RepID=A0ABS1KPF5_9BACT|nr:hypothetical protein [Chryseolinea lacunae]MBL0741315.1 hypothetical protein [Chryseolinea lacunae]
MNRVLKFVACVALGVLAVFLFGWVTMSLWNWLIPVLFAGPVITFWQAMGLLLLSKILFSGLGGGGKRGCHRHSAETYAWKEKFYNKFSSMSPEERAALKQKMKDKWCRWEEGASAKDSTGSNG